MTDTQTWVLDAVRRVVLGDLISTQRGVLRVESGFGGCVKLSREAAKVIGKLAETK